MAEESQEVEHLPEVEEFIEAVKKYLAPIVEEHNGAFHSAIERTIQKMSSED